MPANAPRGTAIKIATPKAKLARSSVTGMRFATSGPTATEFWNEVPKSPLIAFPDQSAYCMYKGLSNPCLCSKRLIACGVACMPSTARAAEPGTTLTAKNSIIEAIIIVGTKLNRLPTTIFHIFTSKYQPAKQLADTLDFWMF